MKQHIQDVAAYITKDGSVIRELIHPTQTAARNQSLAQATVPPGVATHLHLHQATEEIYYILAGQGLMTLGDQQFDVKPGDSILIPPGTPHCIANQGNNDLLLLCCCAPAYSHQDTQLL